LTKDITDHKSQQSDLPSESTDYEAT